MLSTTRVVELVGPPGSGKSTLVSFFQKRNTKFDVTIFPYFRKVSQIPFFTKSLLSLCPTLLYFYMNRGGKELAKRDIALMTILHKWNEVLTHRSAVSGRIIILEEGAICLLAKLSAFGSEFLKTEPATAWWKTTYQKWAKTIGLVVQLDTPIPTLLDRIRSRGFQFEIEKMPDEEAYEYLTKIQTAQVNVLSHLMAEPCGPRLLSFSTTDKSSEQIYTEIIQALNHQ